MRKWHWGDYALAFVLLVLVCCLLGARVQGQDMDLPVPPVRFGDPKPRTTGPTGPSRPDDGEDPSDTPPPVFFGEELDVEGGEIVYVLDQSGSMVRFRDLYEDLDGTIRKGTRWDRALVEATRSILALGEQIRFSVVTFDCGVAAWRRGRLEPATDANKASALAWLRARTPGGATGTGPAVSWALRKPVGVCVLLTDGGPNCGLGTGQIADRARFRLHRRHIQARNVHHVPIDVFGIQARGFMREFCQGVASDSGGRYVDVP